MSNYSNISYFALLLCGAFVSFLKFELNLVMGINVNPEKNPAHTKILKQTNTKSNWDNEIKCTCIQNK